MQAVPGIVLALLAASVSASIAAPASADGARPVRNGTTVAYMPPMATSNEADATQLDLARLQGAAYGQAVDWELAGAMWSQRREAGEFNIAAALSRGEGAWRYHDGELTWTPAPEGTLHLRLFTADAGDGRFVPDLSIQVQLLDAGGHALQTLPVPYGIYPLTDAYGTNLTLPAAATAMAVRVAPLMIERHDPYNGDRYTHTTLARFELPAQRTPPPGASTASERAEQPPPQLAAAQNEALDKTMKAMWKQANDGAQQRAGDYLVDYAVEYAEAYWEPEGTGFGYTMENERSAEHNAHIEAAPRDAATGRFLPDVKVIATLRRSDGSDGSAAGRHAVPMMWHSWLYHYGKNWRVPASGDYRLHLHIDPPPAPRYGQRNGRRMAQPVDVTFAPVHILTGEK